MSEELNSKDLEQINGGAGEAQTIDTLADLEASPIFSTMRSLLGHYKICGHEMDAAMADTIMRSARSYGYSMGSDTANGFVRKYWDLV